MKLKEEPYSFICNDCGEEFDIPENDDLCPYCYSNNIDHKDVRPNLKQLGKFYGKFDSCSYSKRDKYPIPDCKCFIIAMNSCYGSSGYWDGKTCNPDRHRATIYASANAAKKKIKFSSMNEYCYPFVEEANYINNEIV